MKPKLFLVLLWALLVTTGSEGCSKKEATEQTSGRNAPGVTHAVASNLVGTWLWTKGSDLAYYDDNGAYHGSTYGFACQYTVNADGSGSCYSHLYSTIGAGTSITVDVSSTGFFESDDQGHMGYFPLKGTYRSSNGGSRDLRPDELYNVQTKSGACTLYQQLAVMQQDGHTCFQVTASDGTVDRFFKL